ncbi:modulator of macroautophagy TMEM150B isoform X4 [Canis lupus dingo]|uniref:modulator of macroautophagy TMEM150B isoform X4 n=1 Tax=Canis lupus dingo TaxID=286419 RepID=UPI0020C52872|nr:modulator of macroautophagy TMEM150B isoform X4 [Canis lupus dingo]
MPEREKKDQSRGSNCFGGGRLIRWRCRHQGLPSHPEPTHWGIPAAAQRKGEGKASEGEEAGSPGPHTQQPKDRNCTQKGAWPVGLDSGALEEAGSSPEREADRQRKACGPFPSPAEPGMWGYLSLLPAFLALWAITGVWTVFALAVANRSVNLTEGFPYISLCGSYPPQSCIFSQLLNMGAAMAAWICIIRYHQLRDWGVGRWFNQVILWTGLLCALGTSVVGNFQRHGRRQGHAKPEFLPESKSVQKPTG